MKKRYILDQHIKGKIGEQAFKTSIHWRNGVLLTDEPEKAGGKDLGPDPYTLLLSSISACTLATLRKYISHKGYQIPEIEIASNMRQRIKANGEITTTIEQEIGFGDSNIDEKIVLRLLEIAENCPVSRILKGNVITETFKKT